MRLLNLLEQKMTADVGQVIRLVSVDAHTIQRVLLGRAVHIRLRLLYQGIPSIQILESSRSERGCPERTDAGSRLILGKLIGGKVLRFLGLGCSLASEESSY